MPIAARECALAIDRIDRTVVTPGFPMYGSAMRVEHQQFVALGVGMAVARTAVMLVLASLGILVLLPAAIAAQAAVAI
jgi:hypothetical protein